MITVEDKKQTYVMEIDIIEGETAIEVADRNATRIRDKLGNPEARVFFKKDGKPIRVINNYINHGK